MVVCAGWELLFIVGVGLGFYRDVSCFYCTLALLTPGVC